MEPCPTCGGPLLALGINGSLVCPQCRRNGLEAHAIQTKPNPDRVPASRYPPARRDLALEEIEALISHRSDPLPIGGWLILWAVVVVLLPVAHLILLVIHLAELGLSLHSSASINLSPYHLGSAVMHGGLLVYATVLLVLFFQKRRRFPGHVSVYLGLVLTGRLVIMLLTWYTVVPVSDRPRLSLQQRDEIQLLQAASTRNTMGSVVGCGIWLPYFRLSQRVRDTFIR